MGDSGIHEREREFHDALAKDLDPERMPPRPPDSLERALLGRLGDISGRRVLDLGCGVGELSLALLARGARVTGLDLSSGMVEVTKRRAEAFFPHGEFTGRAAPIEATGLPSDSFDLIVGKWILHHAELRPALEELERLRAAGGRAAFIENSSLNPLLMFARRHLAGRFGIPRLGTEDEHPLSRDDYKLIEAQFPSLRLEFPEFFFFRLFDRQVLRFRNRRATRTLYRLDERVHRHAPGLRRYSFRVVVVID